jgi:hypothetical protein
VTTFTAVFSLLLILFIYLRIRLAGHVARMGEERKVCRVLVGKPEEKRPLGRPRLRWKDQNGS